jgi:hypothetical protein
MTLKRAITEALQDLLKCIRKEVTKQMLKKTVLIGTALVFALGILMTSVYRASAETMMETMEVESVAETVADEATTEMAMEVDYALAWPGILPDHFLYPVKMMRDRIWLFLTTDVLKKAETLLKFADKRIFAAQMLLDKGKEDLAVTTATKAEKYLERAIDQAKLAEEKGQEVVGLWEKLSLASRKHEAVLLAMREKASDSSRGVIDDMLEKTRGWLGELKEMAGQN